MAKDMTRAVCTGGTKAGDAALLTGNVVKFWPGCAGLGMRVGVPRPPPNCPSTTSELGTGRLLVRVMVSVSPAAAVIVGPGAQAAVHEPVPQ